MMAFANSTVKMFFQFLKNLGLKTIRLGKLHFYDTKDRREIEALSNFLDTGLSYAK